MALLNTEVQMITVKQLECHIWYCSPKYLKYVCASNFSMKSPSQVVLTQTGNTFFYKRFAINMGVKVNARYVHIQTAEF